MLAEKGRGVHFGIQRLERFIRRCSRNYTEDCYVLKMDIQGFFMAINRRILWSMLRDFIIINYQQADKELLLVLCHKMLANNPTKNCFIKGSRNNWDDLPPNKSWHPESLQYLWAS
jgi:RNA-directed DNA polymerase